MGPEPQWVVDARQGYIPSVYKGYAETNIVRGELAIDIMQRHIAQDRKSLDVFVAGAGFDMLPLQCSAEPYRIAAFLESRGVDYRMTIVDRDPSVIEDIQTRRIVTIPRYKENEGIRTAWENYLRHTGQEDNLTHRTIPEIRSAEYLGQEEVERLASKGIRYAKIPRSFERKLQTGGITLKVDDLAGEAPAEKFDFVTCVNVIYQNYPAARKLIVYNLSTILNKGGLFLLDDLGDEKIFENGWFDKEKQGEIGLQVKEQLAGPYCYYYVLEKQN